MGCCTELQSCKTDSFGSFGSCLNLTISLSSFCTNLKLLEYKENKRKAEKSSNLVILLLNR